MGYAIGVDVGGTFTDFILADGAREIRTHKILSTPDDPSRAVLDGFAALATWKTARWTGSWAPSSASFTAPP